MSFLRKSLSYPAVNGSHELQKRQQPLYTPLASAFERLLNKSLLPLQGFDDNP